MIQAVLFDCWDTILTSDPDQLALIEQQRIDAISWMVRENKVLFGISPHRQTVTEAYVTFWKHVQGMRSNELTDVGLEEHSRVLANYLGIRSPNGLAIELCRQALTSVDLIRNCQVILGAQEALKTIKDMGLRIGLISNTGIDPHSEVVKVLEHFGLRQYFHELVFSDQVGFLKPHPKIFKYALDKLGVEASKTIIIGDDPNADIVGAKLLGMKAILKPHRARNTLLSITEDTQDLIPDKIIHEFDEVLEVVFKLISE
ncbi:MAG TPA: HAD family hydrolase [Candidatus Hodarchaeales archaeon]|nr:HAD family hydrolase [Candidatus Hodarchaeales archaeon]